jgi:hypothetical protein
MGNPRHIFLLLLSGLFLAAGCASTPTPTQFTAYHGTEVFQGQGGMPRTVDGIEFWDDGEPSHRYKILGVIAGSTSGHSLRLSRILPDTGNHDPTKQEIALAEAAHKQGGDAILFINPPGAPATTTDKFLPDTSSGFDVPNDPSSGHRHQTIVVIKYAD